MGKKSELIEGLIDKGVGVEDGDVDVQTVAESDLARVAADEAFMHERVKILLHPTTNPNDPPYVKLTVNDHNNTVVVFRNIPTWVKRCHLEVLARMREDRITQQMTPNSQGELLPENTLRMSSGLAYPFVVLEDRNPRGGQWLANVLAERN